MACKNQIIKSLWSGAGLQKVFQTRHSLLFPAVKKMNNSLGRRIIKIMED